MKAKFIQMIHAEIEAGTPTDRAVDETVEQNRESVLIWASDEFRTAVNKQRREMWKKPPEYEQLRFGIPGQDDVRIPSALVRIVDDDGGESFIPTRFARFDQALASHEAAIEEHRRLMANRERDHSQTAAAQGTLRAAGFDVENLTIDEMKHADTLCFRCGEGRKDGDPFEVGHRVAHAHGGDLSPENLAWVHASCNRTQGTNPDTRR